jgi:formylglycine-generating enzyme required for sulfatase activity
LRRALAIGVVLGALGVAASLAIARRNGDTVARCGPGFVPSGWSCSILPEGGCPPPLQDTAHGCDAPDTTVLIPASAIAVGPSDWEAEGRVRPRAIRVQSFRVDVFEATRGHWGRRDGDPVRAASGMTRSEADAYCGSRAGRLPTEDEWIAAAASATNPPRRYPWGDTGAVCRRAAWGLANGPCAVGADGPDVVAAHPDGDSPLGLHDLAGNVAEWVAPDAARPGVGVAKGGSWQDALATELRIWARLELDAEQHDPRVGVRCVYPP